MGVTTANDKSDFSYHGFSINKYCADSSTWQTGNFIITKHFMLLKTHHVYNGGGGRGVGGKRCPGPESWERIRIAVYGDGIAAGLRRVTLPSLTHHMSCDGSSRGESGQQVRHDHGVRAENNSVGSLGWQPRRGLIAAPTPTAVLLRSHFKSTGFKEKGIDMSVLTNQSSLQSSKIKN